MVQVSFVGYASAGAFLGLAYFDYYYTLVALVILCKTVLMSDTVSRAAELAANAAQPPLAGGPAAAAAWSSLKPGGPPRGLREEGG
jgi:hypothetical protein